MPVRSLAWSSSPFGQSAPPPTRRLASRGELPRRVRQTVVMMMMMLMMRMVVLLLLMLLWRMVPHRLMTEKSSFDSNPEDCIYLTSVLPW